MSDSDIAVVDNGRKGVTVRKPVGLSIAEKQRIEKLVDSRVQGLMQYVDELSTMASELSANIPFSRRDERDAIEKQVAQLDLELDKLRNKESEDIALARKVLDDEYDVQRAELDAEKLRLQELIKVLDQKIISLDATYDIDLKSVTEEINRKWNRKDSDQQKKRDDLINRKDELDRLARAEASLASTAFQSQLSNIRSGVQDHRNRSVEKIWTGCESTHDAQIALNLIPDTITIRAQLTPQMLCESLNNALVNAALPTSVLKCKKCSRNTVDVDKHGYCRCSACGTGYYLSDTTKSMVKTLALPSFGDLMSKVGATQKALPNG